jgi:hypothetical protein
MTRSQTLRVVLALLALGCTRCSSSSSAHADAAATDTGTDQTADAPDSNDDAAADSPADSPSDATDTAAAPLFGTIAVDLITDDHTAFLGAFFDGPRPDATPMDVAQMQGDCRLVVPRAISCEGGCAAGSTCTGNVCERNPKQVSVGVLHVHGLGGGDLELEPSPPSAPSYQAVPTLPYPSCGEGDDVTASADSFTTAAKCVGALELESAAPIPVVSGQAMHLAWKAPARAGISRIEIELEISHHGGYKGQIECDVADTGAFDVPANLVTALVALGRAGYPTVKVARTSKATAPTQPGVALVVASRVEVDVDTGVVSCGADSSPPCPDGETCQPDYTCR